MLNECIIFTLVNFVITIFSWIKARTEALTELMKLVDQIRMWMRGKKCTGKSWDLTCSINFFSFLHILNCSYELHQPHGSTLAFARENHVTLGDGEKIIALEEAVEKIKKEVSRSIPSTSIKISEGKALSQAVDKFLIMPTWLSVTRRPKMGLLLLL